MVDSLQATADGLSGFSKDLSAGKGLLPKLVKDEDFARELMKDLSRISGSLARVAEKLDRGDGTAGKLVNDPAVYDAIDDILVGVNESKLLRWLVRNRQRSGIQVRYEGEKANRPRTRPEALGPAPTPEPKE
jgi:hypothetical protein